MTQKIQCKREGCDGVVAKIDGKLVSIGRRQQMFRLLGDNYTAVCTCPNNSCKELQSIVMKDGKLQKDNLILIKDKKDGEPKDGDKKESGSKDTKDNDKKESDKKD